MRISRPAGILLRKPVSAGIQTGADPAVLTNSFDVQAYATSRGFGTIPAETGPTQEPIADQGAVGNGVADDTSEVVAAMNALPSTGGVLDLSQGIFALQGTDDLIQIGNKNNITIKGGGWSHGVAQTSGLRVLGSDNANRFNAAVRYSPGGNNQNLVIRDLEIDVNSQQFGAITTENDDNTWIIGVYAHDVGDGGAGSPNAAIRGINTQTGHRWIANIVDTTTAAGSSAVRGLWTTEDDFIAGVINHNILIDIAHSGIIPGVGVGGTTFCENNSVFRPGLNAGAAGIKCERSTNLDPATAYQPALTQSIYARNYIEMDNPEPGGNQGPWAIQAEGTGCTIEQNLIDGCQRFIASFNQGQGMRNILVQNNVASNIQEYGVFWDPTAALDQDNTQLLVLNNTMSGPASFEFGIQFHPNWSSNPDAFDFNNDIDVIDNNITGNSGSDVDAPSSVTGYANYTDSGNGSGGTGALFVLLPPTYAGTL